MAHDSSEPCSLEEVLVQSGLTADFYYNDRLLYVHEYPEYDELLKHMREIYTNKSYNMYYVQTDRYYTASVEIAMLSDCIKNFSFISQVTGSENRKLYEDAFWRIITPDSDADMKILETQGEVGETLADAYDIGDDTLDALLENGNVNSLMYESGKAVVNVYTGEETLQTLYFERLIHENIIEKTEEFIKDTSEKLLPSAGGIFIDTLNNQILCYTDEMKKSGKSMFLEALVPKGELTVDSQDELWIRLEGAIDGASIDTCELPGNPDFASEDYLNRAPTGIWYYSIVIENGMPAQAYY